MPACEALDVTIDIPDLPVICKVKLLPQLKIEKTHIGSVAVSSWKSGTVEDGHGGVYHVSVHEDHYPP